MDSRYTKKGGRKTKIISFEYVSLFLGAFRGISAATYPLSGLRKCPTVPQLIVWAGKSSKFARFPAAQPSGA